ncbi:hypothetical protein F5Y15DRAFT_177170 [Xylariaceae sp. FL0016]|nr:hypothetical protein F5Y15DRAFT_177170 [Xylariaceae sp. FL0016]
MLGINQLPEGAEGAAAVSLIYSSASWICSALLIWLTWVHHERWSYVAIVAYWSCLSTTASIVQQIHDITWWQDVMMEQFRRTSKFSDNPELAIANGSYGLDLALYYIQYYTYNVEAMCVLFWASELAQTLYGFDAKPRWKHKLRTINVAGKYISMILPLITILLLRVPQIQGIFVLFIILADIPLMLSLTLGSITMIAILVRYVQTRKKFSQWSAPNGTSNTNETGATEGSSPITESGTYRTKKNPEKKPGIYDRWLMVRFTCAFFVLGVFDVTNTLFQLTATQNNRKDLGSTEPDLSVARANSTFFLFMPGASPGVFLFLIFGTTTGHRQMICETFLPRRWQKQRGSRGFLRHIPWPPSWPWSRSWRRVTDPPAMASSPQSTLPVASSIPSDARSKSGDVMKPLPARPTSISQLRSMFSRSPVVGDGDDIFSDKEGYRMKDLEAARGVQEGRGRYYRPRPEESDDSGPVLPIMR